MFGQGHGERGVTASDEDVDVGVIKSVQECVCLLSARTEVIGGRHTEQQDSGSHIDGHPRSQLGGGSEDEKKKPHDEGHRGGAEMEPTAESGFGIHVCRLLHVQHRRRPIQFADRHNDGRFAWLAGHFECGLRDTDNADCATLVG